MHAIKSSDTIGRAQYTGNGNGPEGMSGRDVQSARGKTLESKKGNVTLILGRNYAVIIEVKDMASLGVEETVNESEINQVGEN